MGNNGTKFIMVVALATLVGVAELSAGDAPAKKGQAKTAEVAKPAKKVPKPAEVFKQGKDTAALKKMLNSGAGMVNLPAGTYELGPEPIEIPANVSLRGAGRATILKPVKGTGVLFNLKSGSQIRDLAIDGKGVKKGRVQQGMIVLRRANGCLIDSIYVTNCDRASILADHANDLVIQNCDFRDVGMGIHLVFSNRVKVLGNSVVNARLHAIQFWGSIGSGRGKEHERIGSKDLIFANNYVKNGGGGAIWGAGGRWIIMTGNIIDGVRDVGLDPEFCEDVVISGNVTRNCYNAGISLFFTCKRVTITGNTIYNNAMPNDKQKAAIHTMLQRKLTEKEKRLTWFVRSGIWLVPPNREKMATDTGHEDITIVGNTIYTVGDDNIPRRDIWIGAESKNVRIESNTLSGHGVYYGGHHAVHPQTLIKLGPQPLMIDNMPTPDKPKF